MSTSGSEWFVVLGRKELGRDTMTAVIGAALALHVTEWLLHQLRRVVAPLGKFLSDLSAMYCGRLDGSFLLRQPVLDYLLYEGQSTSNPRA